jgi:hypothetical protein
MAGQLAENMVVVFFLDPDISTPDLKLVEERIKTSPAVVRVNHISRQQALERFEKNFPELGEIIKNLGANPFPPSLEATLQREVFMSDEILGFIEEIKNVQGVEDIQFNREWVRKMQSLSRLARAVGFFLGGILILQCHPPQRLCPQERDRDPSSGRSNQHLHPLSLSSGRHGARNPGELALPGPALSPDQALPLVSGRLSGGTPGDGQLPLSVSLSISYYDFGRSTDGASGESEFSLPLPEDLRLKTAPG